ncbi:MAG TPA: hypothetical protein DIV79_03640 [Opitutae bacterium]|nr:hypothetical protein [Opitutae bacterium]
MVNEIGFKPTNFLEWAFLERNFTVITVKQQKNRRIWLIMVDRSVAVFMIRISESPYRKN